MDNLITKNAGKRITLDFIKTDKFKTGYVSVNFLCPLSGKTAAENALLFPVLQRGCEKYPDMKSISSALDKLYGAEMFSRNTVRGETEILSFGVSYISERYVHDGTQVEDGTLNILKELITKPYLPEKGTFSASYTSGEKNNLHEAIAAKINNKTSYAIKRCREIMCADEAYGVSELGTDETVDAVTPESLYEAYKRVMSDSDIEIFVMSDGELSYYEKFFTEMFAGVFRSEKKTPRDTAVIRKAGEIKRKDEDEPVTQGKLAIGFRTGIVSGERLYPAFSLFNEIFGSGTTSKLFMNVREKQSLCYYCTSIPEALKGIITVTAGIDNQNREVTEKAILHELSSMKNGDFTDEDIEDARRSVITRLRTVSDSAQLTESWYMLRRLSGVMMTPEEYEGKIKVTCAGEIREAAQLVTPDTFYFLHGTKESKPGENGDDDDE